jgi:hypothetical protein
MLRPSFDGFLSGISRKSYYNKKTWKSQLKFRSNFYLWLLMFVAVDVRKNSKRVLEFFLPGPGLCFIRPPQRPGKSS